MRLLTSFIFITRALIAQQASLEGVAANAVTHEPLSGVQVHLFGVRPTDQGPITGYGAVSDRAGHFSINVLPPGMYLLMPELRGFVYGQPKQGGTSLPSVRLKPGQNLNDFKLEMMPRAVITGRVLDEFGDPVRWSEVEAEQVSNEIAMAGGLRGDGKLHGQTDERGVFQLTGYPTKYYIQAQPSDDLRDVKTDGTVPAHYAATYYPSAPGKSSAAGIEAAPGGDVTGIDIRLIRSAKQQFFNVSGTVRGLPDGEDQGECLVIFQESGNGRFGGGYNARCDKGGSFTMSGIAPGQYRVAARHRASVSLATEFRLEGTDVQNIQLTLRSNAEVAGKLEVDGGSTFKGKVRLTATMRIPGLVVGGGEFGGDGSFRLSGVPVGESAVTVDSLPEDAYLKAIQFNGSPISGRFINIEASGANTLKILVSLKAARLSGIARGQDGEPLTDGLSLVYLISDVDKARPRGSDSQRSVRVGEDGKYSFKALRPGKYRLIAVDAFHSANFEDAEAFKKAAAAAEEFEVKEGDRITRDIRAAPDGRVDAKAK